MASVKNSPALYDERTIGPDATYLPRAKGGQHEEHERQGHCPSAGPPCKRTCCTALHLSDLRAHRALGAHSNLTKLPRALPSPAPSPCSHPAALPPSPEAHDLLPVAPPVLKLLGRHKLGDVQVLGRGLQVLAQRQDVHTHGLRGGTRADAHTGVGRREVQVPVYARSLRSPPCKPRKVAWAPREVQRKQVPSAGPWPSGPTKALNTLRPPRHAIPPAPLPPCALSPNPRPFPPTAAP